MGTDNKFDYGLADFERVSCNFCGWDDYDPISRQDRYGLPVTTVICRTCGLVYINPRMTARHYDKFYQLAYRGQLELYKGSRLDLDKMFKKATELGMELAARLAPFVNPGPTVEVGSSCGGILNGLKLSRSDLDIIGLEPSATEASYAQAKGIKTIVSLFENFQAVIGPFQNIFIVRSLNHLLDPRKFLQWSYKHLAPGGRLIIVVLDFVAACQRRGALKTQVDHPFMFTERVLSSFVQSGGFRIDYCLTDGDYTYLAASKGDGLPFNALTVDLRSYPVLKRSLSPWRLGMCYWLGRVARGVRLPFPKKI